MFCIRFTALIDACVLAGALKRNLLLSLAEADFFRIRWSDEILDETERAIARILTQKAVRDAHERAKRARKAMERAFPEATMQAHETLSRAVPTLPDPDDNHVVAAAIRTHVSVIITDNLKHFPAHALSPLGVDVLSADAFVTEMVTFDPSRAAAAIRRMRERLKRPEKTVDMLLLDMEANGMTESARALRLHQALL